MMKSSTYPLILLATEECLDIDFGDISNSESDLERVVYYILTDAHGCIVYSTLSYFCHFPESPFYFRGIFCPPRSHWEWKLGLWYLQLSEKDKDFLEESTIHIQVWLLRPSSTCREMIPSCLAGWSATPARTQSSHPEPAGPGGGRGQHRNWNYSSYYKY